MKTTNTTTNEAQRPLPDARDLAYKFSALLREELGDEIEEVIARNQNEANPSVCHSHDFTDANEIMAAAFLAVAGFPVFATAPGDGSGVTTQDGADGGGMSEECGRAWDAAWNLAKADEFAVDCVTDEERSNGRHGA